MSFYMPLGLIGLIGVPILILIYILRRRYEEEIVPSTFLWKRSLQYMKKKFPWNLRNSILLLLQILAIVLVSLILSRAYVTSWKSGETIVILDTSASMMSEDDAGVTRFSRACAKIEQLADEADGNHRVTIITAGGEAKKVIHRSDVRQNILNALHGCAPTWKELDLDGALLIAQETQKDNAAANIVFYTDETYESQNGVEVVNVTNQEWNAAVLDLQVEQVGGAYRFVGQVATYGKDEDLMVLLYVDGNFVSSKKVSCIDGEKTEVSFREYSANSFSQATVVLDPDLVSDGLATDNRFEYHNTAKGNILIQAVFGPSHRDDFLTSALRAVKGVSVTAIQIEALDENGCENHVDSYGNAAASRVKYSGYDLYVFDGIQPEFLPDDGAIWLVNPLSIPTGIGAQVGETVSIADTRKCYLSSIASQEEPYAAILAGLALEEIEVRQYAPLSSDTYVPLLVCDGETVLLAGEEGHTKVMLMSIGTSSLPSDLSDYPLLINNMLSYSCQTVFEQKKYHVGDTATIIVPPGAEEITVSLQDLPVTVTEAQDMMYSFETPGKYEILISLDRTPTANGKVKTEEKYKCYVSISENESNIYGYEAEIVALEVPEGAVANYEPVEIWQYLLIALLVALTAEWWVYYRV